MALSQIYGKDIHGVWVLINPFPEGELATEKIIGADPKTFALMPDPNDPGGEGFSEEYTKDKSHVYALERLVNDANPGTFKLVDPPKGPLSCRYDAEDGKNKYFLGFLFGC